MPSIYGYARVSTTAQAEAGNSLGEQERFLTGWDHMHGTPLTEVFIERGVSGSDPLGDRPQGKLLLAKLKRGDTVVASKMDRIFRSARDALNVVEDLQQRGIRVVLLDLGGDVASNGMGKLFMTILAAVAEAERDRIRDRISVVKEDQRKRGRYLGGKVPFGYRVSAEGALEPVEAQQAAITRAVALRQAGEPLRSIRATLAAEGVALSLDALHRITGGAPA